MQDRRNEHKHKVNDDSFKPVPSRAKPRVGPLGGKKPGWDGKANQQRSKKKRAKVKGHRGEHCRILAL